MKSNKKKNITNVAASVRARLLNISKKLGRDFNAVLLQYFQERFLYRLSISSYKKKFILKGALLFLIYDVSPFRPTKDIDFLGLINTTNLNDVKKIFADIVQIPVNDGVHFDITSMRIEPITEENEYNGIRIKFKARLGTIRKVLQLDVGVGDIVIPKPIEKTFPTYLDDISPRILVYSNESMIAEKFEAIVRFNYLTSRMKDFYDILHIGKNNTFQMSLLNKALIATFNNRHTMIEDQKIIFKSDFRNKRDKQEQWMAFLTRNHLQTYNNFSEVVEQLELFIEPVCEFQKDEEKDGTWKPKEWKWER